MTHLPSQQVHSFTGVSGYTATDHYAAAAGTLRGNATAFSVATLLRFIGVPGGQRDVFGSYEIYQPNGGWGLAVEPTRAVFICGQASDGQTIQNYGDGHFSWPTYGPWWQLHGRPYLMTMAFDGTTANCYVNGELVRSMTPASGYQPASVSMVPYIGRNNNSGAPLPVENVEVLGCGYVEANVTHAEIIDHWLAVQASGNFADLPTTGFDNRWDFAGETTAPSTLSDLNGNIDFSRVGTGLVATTRRAVY